MVFGTIVFTTWTGFCLFQADNRNTKNTRARCEICVKLTIMTPEFFDKFYTFIWYFIGDFEQVNAA